MPRHRGRQRVLDEPGFGLNFHQAGIDGFERSAPRGRPQLFAKMCKALSSNITAGAFERVRLRRETLKVRSLSRYAHGVQ